MLLLPPALQMSSDKVVYFACFYKCIIIWQFRNIEKNILFHYYVIYISSLRLCILSVTAGKLPVGVNLSNKILIISDTMVKLCLLPYLIVEICYWR